jgi:hypothetical protein
MAGKRIIGDEWPRKVEATEKSKVAGNDFVTAGHPAKVVAARDGRQRRRSAVAASSRCRPGERRSRLQAGDEE